MKIIDKGTEKIKINNSGAQKKLQIQKLFKFN
jgi:hypothetical protein